jgi:hypothetical protein
MSCLRHRLVVEKDVRRGKFDYATLPDDVPDPMDCVCSASWVVAVTKPVADKLNRTGITFSIKREDVRTSPRNGRGRRLPAGSRFILNTQAAVETVGFMPAQEDGTKNIENDRY